jgi:hypothetical protein
MKGRLRTLFRRQIAFLLVVGAYSDSTPASCWATGERRIVSDVSFLVPCKLIAGIIVPAQRTGARTTVSESWTMACTQLPVVQFYSYAAMSPDPTIENQCLCRRHCQSLQNNSSPSTNTDNVQNSSTITVHRQSATSDVRAPLAHIRSTHAAHLYPEAHIRARAAVKTWL